MDNLCGYRLHCGPVLHRQVRPPCSCGVLCSKSARAEGRRHIGPVQVACRIWVRCRSLTPGSWPGAWNRWSQVSRAIGSIVMSRGSWPGMPVASRQVPYPPGGPGWLVAVKVKVNPGSGGRAGRNGNGDRCSWVSAMPLRRDLASRPGWRGHRGRAPGRHPPVRHMRHRVADCHAPARFRTGRLGCQGIPAADARQIAC